MSRHITPRKLSKSAKDAAAKNGCGAVMLNRGMFSLVDKEDEYLGLRFRWDAVKKKTGFYAIRRFEVKSAPKRKRGTVYLHREIMGNPKGEVHHIYCETLDNRKSRLEILDLTTHRHSATKSKKHKSSKFIGVSRYKSLGKYVATVVRDGKRMYLGAFVNEKDAAIARDIAVSKLNDGAVLNFPYGP